MKNKRLFSFITVIIMLFSVCTALPMKISVPLETSASGIDNIAARADYLYNITWTAQTTVKGWRNNYTFTQGNTYHIPYGQPVTKGKYICWGVSVDDFLVATQNASSIFYTSRSVYNSKESTYYSMDCSALASYCWNLPSRTTTAGWANLDVTDCGKCTSTNVNKIQKGDALNYYGGPNANNHIVIVSDVTYDSSGNVTQVEITEQTPPETKRSYYTASSLASKYSSYTIYRYNKRDSVPPSPNATSSSFPGEEDNSYSLPISVTASKKINTYDGNGNLESNRWIDAGDVCTIDKVYKNGFVHIGYPTSGGTRWAYAKKDDFDINPPAPSYQIPEICVDSVTAGIGTISIGGWAYDPDNKDASLIIRAYMDHDMNQLIGETVTQYDDEDALKAAIGSATVYKHRFAATFYTNQTGNHSINIAAFDSNSDNAAWSDHDISIPADTEAPNISNVEISDITEDGYRITIEVSDNVEVKKVAVPTWTNANGQDDLFAEWDKTALATQIPGTNTWVYDVKFSDHNNERDLYVSHIYAWDTSDNLSKASKTVDMEAPKISDVEISDITTNGYRVTIEVSDNVEVKKVAVPTWTSAGGQDDLFAEWDKTALATQIPGTNTWVYDVKTADHNNECGIYYTDVYAWDSSDNLDIWHSKNNKRKTVSVGVYKFTVNPNGGTINDSTNAVTYDTKLIYNQSNWSSATSCIPKRTGYIFTGFYTSATGGTKIYGADGKCVNEGKYFKDNLYKQAGDLTVYAQWQAETVIGDVNADGEFSIADAVILQKWLLGVPDTKLADWENADLCKDGKLDVFDFCIMRKMLVNS